MNGLDPNRHPLPDRERASEPGQEPRTVPPPAESDARLPRPAGWLRFAQGPLTHDQVLKNLEQIVSLLQTAQIGLGQIDTLLQELTTALSVGWSQRQHHPAPPDEMRALVAKRMATIEEIARECRFHGRGLLDGQSGAVGSGKGLVFVRGGPNTATSPPEGYEARITEFPTRAAIVGGVTLNEDWVWAEREIFLAEGDRYVRFAPKRNESVLAFLADLQDQVRAAGLDLEVGLTRQRRLAVRHTQYGSQFRFKGSSLTTPLLSRRPGKIEWSRKGKDIQGTLGGEPAFGIGRMLVGFLDNEKTSELAVVWKGDLAPPGAGYRCQVLQNGILFQDGADPESPPLRISVPSFQPPHLGRWVDTRSGFASLAALRVDAWQEVLDGLYLLLAVQGEVIEWKDRLRAWIERYQNRALLSLRQGMGMTVTRSVDSERALRAERMASVLLDHIHAERRAAK